MRISDWSSDVCSSDLCKDKGSPKRAVTMVQGGTCRNDSRKGQVRIPNQQVGGGCSLRNPASGLQPFRQPELTGSGHLECGDSRFELAKHDRIDRSTLPGFSRSADHTSDVQSQMGSPYANLHLKK